MKPKCRSCRTEWLRVVILSAATLFGLIGLIILLYWVHHVFWVFAAGAALLIFLASFLKRRSDHKCLLDACVCGRCHEYPACQCRCPYCCGKGYRDGEEIKGNADVWCDDCHYTHVLFDEYQFEGSMGDCPCSCHPNRKHRN